LVGTSARRKYRSEKCQGNSQDKQSVEKSTDSASLKMGHAKRAKKCLLACSIKASTNLFLTSCSPPFVISRLSCCFCAFISRTRLAAFTHQPEEEAEVEEQVCKGIDF
jgi:hypothetical protein